MRATLAFAGPCRKRDAMRFPRLSAMLILLAAALSPAMQAETVARHRMVAASNPYAAKAALEMLRQGGSAVDAAIAAQMVLTLV